ncbi:hypothetical protein PQR02_27875 [Paraburkholderia sediminicola]|uniref:Uncharacterized protein n=1 Tax=Paraburkholderia rhynchosiae TaxID=487049 RepID=A0ACC7NHU7_9BURK
MRLIRTARAGLSWCPRTWPWLVNTLAAIEPVAPDLQHVSLMQGYKVYGGHQGPFKTPARDNDAHFVPPEFVFDQQRLLETRQAGKRWNWSALRPAVLGGFALGNPMNPALAIAVYAVAYQDVSSWRFADFVFSSDYDMFGDGSKARRFGFHEFIDTETMFIDIFDNLRRRKLIP